MAALVSAQSITDCIQAPAAAAVFFAWRLGLPGAESPSASLYSPAATGRGGARETL